MAKQPKQNTPNSNPKPVVKTKIPSSMPFDAVDSSSRFDDVYKIYRPIHCQKVTSYRQDWIFRFKNDMAIKISWWADDLFCVSYSLEGEFTDGFSYAIDSAFGKSNPRIQFEDQEGVHILRSNKLQIRLQKSDGALAVFDADGTLLSMDIGFRAKWTQMKGLQRLQLTKEAAPGASFFGLGDKTCALNLRGQKLNNWCTDAFAYGAETDPLYRAIPFVVNIHEGRSHGIYLDNTSQTTFNFDAKGSGKWSMKATGGEFRYFFIAGDRPVDVVARYTQLTGLPELPPLWGLGFHQCRWSYFPDTRVKEVADTFRELQIPCDAIYLDIDYMDVYRCFTWDYKLFPAPKTLISDLKNKGFQTVVMIDPGLKVDPNYEVYREGLANDMFCKRTDGTLMKGPVWPLDCVFPEFTNPKVRNWWGQLYHDLYCKEGVSGFWNDMNEPAVFKINRKTFPDEVLHDVDGHPTNHKVAHNIYGMQMSRATQEGLKKLQPEKRPFLLARATFSGGQRYAALWTGDNLATWEHLRLACTQILRLATSGFSFAGSDIGGFVDMPTGELMARWLQLGVFHPFYRIHSMGNNVDGAGEADQESVRADESKARMDQEPWSFGDEFTKLNRQAIEFRYQLLPAIYTAFYQYTQTGTPINKALHLLYPDDDAALDCSYTFIMGDHLLVSPVLEEGTEIHTTYLPKGDWLAFQDGTLLEGGTYVKTEVTIESIPMWVRRGGLIPLYPTRQHTQERDFDEITLKIFGFKHGVSSHFYDDAGDGYGYTSDGFSLRTYTCLYDNEHWKIEQTTSGAWAAPYGKCKIQWFGIGHAPRQLMVDGEKFEFEFQNDILFAVVPLSFSSLELIW